MSFDINSAPGIPLTAQHRCDIELSIELIDHELGQRGQEYEAELNRQRRHLVAMLATGMTLQEPGRKVV